MTRIGKLMVLILCLAVWLLGMTSLAAAKKKAPEGKGKIVFIPHDNRPISDQQTADTIRQLGYEVIVPPDNMLGDANNMGDPDKLWQWLDANTTVPHKPNKKPPYKSLPNIKAVVVSGDAMIYGSLIGSRKHDIPEAKLMERVDRFKEFAVSHPHTKLYVFSSVMRTPRTGQAAGIGEPDYYTSYGSDIFRYTALMDKAELQGLSAREKKEVQFLKELMPAADLKDWLGRRQKNLAVNKAMIDLTKQGIFSYFCLGRDDNAPFSQTHMESRWLKDYAQNIDRSHLNCMAGIDEFAMLLMTRAVNDITKQQPTVYVRYNWGEGPDVIPAYSDEPIEQTIQSHIIMAGGRFVSTPGMADLVLLVNTNPNGQTMDANDLEKNGEKLKASAKYFVNMVQEELLHGSRVSVADIAYANGSDNSMMYEMSRRNLLFKLQSYSGWNTPTNSTGFALGQGMLARQMSQASREKLLYTRYLDDWAYQANVRQDIYRRLKYFTGKGNGNNLDEKLLQAETSLAIHLRDFAKGNLPQFIDTRNIYAVLPWHRLFECQPNF